MTGPSAIDNATISNASGEINLIGATLTLDDTTLNSGTITGSDGGAISVDLGDMLTLNGVTASGSGTGTVNNSGMVSLSGTSLTLGGSGFTLALDGAGTLALNGKTLKVTGTGDSLDNNGNTISGPGQIGSGTSNALALDNISGTIEAIGGTLKFAIGSPITNSGLLQAANTGSLDVTSSTVNNNGTNPLAPSGATGILVTGTFVIDNPTTAHQEVILAGSGSGVVALNGGTIEGNSANAETLDNSNNLIFGFGNIGIGTDQLTLQNDATGTIEAQNGVLAIHTGHTVINAGTLEAGTGGSLQIDDTVTNTGSIQALGGAHLVFDNATISNLGTIALAEGSLGSFTSLIIQGTLTLQNAGGAFTLATDSQIVSNLSAATLISVNDISGAGTIGNLFLTFDNDAGGTVDATGFLTLNAGSLDNEGLLEATAGNGGELLVHSIVDNAGGTVAASGGFVDFELGITGGGATISDNGKLEYGWLSTVNTTFDGPGTLVLDHQNQADSNFDTASYTGAISGFGAGDTLDVTDLTFSVNDYALWTQTTTANGGSGTLAIYNSVGALQASLNLNGSYTQGEFALASDGAAANPGTDVNFNNTSFNYISFLNGTINTNGNVMPVVGNAGSTLELTDGNPSEAASWFATNQVAIGSFTASFDYQATPQGGGLADGMAFILQDDSNGSHALGGTGSSLGYGLAQDDTGGTAISPSAAVEFNVYVSNLPGTNFATDGGFGSYNPTGDVDFADTGDEIQIVLNYNGRVLTETLTDLVNGNTFSTTYDGVDLAQILGSDTAYVGFSAATGASESTQTLSNFTFSAGPPPVVDIWQGPTSDNEWSTGSNWSNGAPPEGEHASIGSGGNPHVDSPVTADDVGLINFGTIDVGTAMVGASFTLDDGTTIAGGTLSIGSLGMVDVEAGPGNIVGPDAELEGVAVTNSGNIEVGETSSATLLFKDDTTVYGGTLSIGFYGTLDIEAGSNDPTGNNGPDVTFDGVTLYNNYFGNIEVGVSSSATLLLDDDTTVYGSGAFGATLTIGSAGELDVETGSGGSGYGATLDGVNVIDNGAIDVDLMASGAILTLDDATTVTGGGRGH